MFRFKEDFTFRKRLPVLEFIDCSFEALNKWSLERNGVTKPFQMAPCIRNEQWGLAKDFFWTLLFLAKQVSRVRVGCSRRKQNHPIFARKTWSTCISRIL